MCLLIGAYAVVCTDKPGDIGYMEIKVGLTESRSEIRPGTYRPMH